MIKEQRRGGWLRWVFIAARLGRIAATIDARFDD